MSKANAIFSGIIHAACESELTTYWTFAEQKMQEFVMFGIAFHQLGIFG